MNRKGLTLVELLIVVSVISFLAILITVFLRSQVFKGNDARKKADIKRIGIAVEEYEKDNNCYPIASLVSCNPGKGLTPYINKIPCDPITKASYMYEHEDSSCPRWYRIYGLIENESDVDYIDNIGPNGDFTYYYSSPNAPSPSQAVSGGSEVTEPPTDFYGCISGACTLLTWDPTRPGPSCDPNFQNPTCYGQCANPVNECEPWGGN